MKMDLHLMEPWLIEKQYIKYNLGESGITDITLGEVMERTHTPVEELLQCSFKNNDTYGSLELRASIASFYDHVSPDQVIVTTGVSEALFIYYHLRFEPGANVIVPFPAFQTLYEVPKYLGYEVRLLELDAEEGFRINMERLKSLIDSNTKVIVLNNPHNPTGVSLTDREMDEIIALADQHGIEILADEHYRFIPYGEEQLIPSLYGKYKRVVAVGSMIKCLGCVGLRVGWVIADKELIDQIRDFKDYTTHTICSINDFLARRLLLHWEKIGLEYKAWILANVAEFRKLIHKHQSVIDWVEPEGGIVAFPFLKDRTIGSQYFAEKLATITEISVLPGEAFERPGHFRVGFGVPPELFRKAMELLSDFIEARRWEQV